MVAFERKFVKTCWPRYGFGFSDLEMISDSSQKPRPRQSGGVVMTHFLDVAMICICFGKSISHMGKCVPPQLGSLTFAGVCGKSFVTRTSHHHGASVRQVGTKGYMYPS